MKIEADLHMHTVGSGHGYSTIKEMSLAAVDKGLKLIAITDHGPSLPGGPAEVYFRNMKILPDYINDIKILRGVEANINKDGGIDLNEENSKWLNFIAAGIHSNIRVDKKTIEEYTAVTIEAIKNPLVMMITHPDNLSYPVDLLAVVEAAAEYNVILEVNASSFDQYRYGIRSSLERTVEMCILAKKHKVPLSLNSDAHFYMDVGNIKNLSEVIEMADLKNDDVINTSIEKIKDFCKEYRRYK